MAYQPKSYRKFLATGVAAAMVATAVTPIGSVAAAEQGTQFTDLQGFDYAKDAIAYLVEKGAIEGKGNGKFDPAGTLKRGEIAAILVRALGLTVDTEATTSLTDLDGHWSKPYVATVQAELPGVIDGFTDGTFRPEATVTRAQLAKMVVTAYPELKLNENADLNFVDASQFPEWAKDEIMVLASQGIVQGSNNRFDANGSVIRAHAALFVHRTEVPAVRTEVPAKPVTDLAVVSVSAINLNTIQVEFSQAVDTDSAQTVSNYQIDGVNLANANAAILSGDDRIVTIILDTPRLQSSKVELKVRNNVILAKDSSKTVPEFKQEITFSDVAAPKVASVSVSGNRQVTVNFDQAVDLSSTVGFGTTFKINGSSLASFGFADATVKAHDGSAMNNERTQNTGYANKVQLNFASNLPAGTHKLTIPAGTQNGILGDAAGFAVAETEIEFTIEDVTGAPSVEKITGTTNGVVYVDFNRAMRGGTGTYDATRAANYTIDGVAATGARIESGTGNKKIRLVFPSGTVREGSNTLEINKNVSDRWQNRMHADDNVRVSFTADKDTTKPEVKHVVVVDNNQIRIKFSEVVKGSFARNASNYVLRDASGTRISVTGAMTGDSDVVTLTTGSTLTAQTYTLEVKNIEDLAGNKMDDYKTTVSGSNNIKPTIVTDGVYKVNNQRAVVAFTEQMNTTDLLNRANYSYKDEDGATRELPVAAKLTVGEGGKSVIIDFPTTHYVKDDVEATPGGFANALIVTELRVLNIKDVSGNVLDTTGFQVIKDVAPAAVAPAYVANTFRVFKDGDNIKAEFEMTETITTRDWEDFEVRGLAADGTTWNWHKAGSNANVTISGKKVTLTFTNATVIEEIKRGGASVQLRTDSTNSTNANGVAIAAITATTVERDDIRPEWVTASTVVGTNSVQGNSTNGVIFTFSEAIDDSIRGEYKGDFTFVTNTGTYLNVAEVYVQGTQVKYTFSNTADLNAASSITVKATSSNKIRDMVDEANTRNTFAPTSAQRNTGVTVDNPGAAVTLTGGPLQVGEANVVTAGSTETGSAGWTSSNTAVATINPTTGVITPLAAGTTTISYTSSTSGKVNSLAVTVNAAATVANPAYTVVQVGEGNVIPTGFTAAGAGETIAWTSATPATATVNATTGIISPLVAGTTTVSYTVTNDTTGLVVAKGSVNVTVHAAAASVAPAYTGTGAGGNLQTGDAAIALATPITAGAGQTIAFTSSTPANITVNATTGVLSWVQAGTSTISYTITDDVTNRIVQKGSVLVTAQ